VIVCGVHCWLFIALRKNALAAATSRLVLSLKSTVRPEMGPSAELVPGTGRCTAMDKLEAQEELFAGRHFDREVIQSRRTHRRR
jgi:hypothetical protein